MRGGKWWNRDAQADPAQDENSRQLDIVSPLPLAMRFACDMMGTDRLLFSSDHPWVDPKLILGGLRSLTLPRADEERILQGNARQLFHL